MNMDVFKTFNKYFFRFKTIANTKILRKYKRFRAKKANNSRDAQNLPDVTNTRDLIGQIK
jgi:hypothetical protein